MFPASKDGCRQDTTKKQENIVQRETWWYQHNSTRWMSCQYKNLEEENKLEMVMQNISKVEGERNAWVKPEAWKWCTGRSCARWTGKAGSRKKSEQRYPLWSLVEIQYKFRMEFSTSCFTQMLAFLIFVNTGILNYRRSQKRRLVEVWRTSGGDLVQHPCSSRVTKSPLPRPCPDGLWISPRMGTLQPLWETCASAWSPSH